MKETTVNPNSVPLSDDTDVLLDIPETKKELLSETEEEIEEWDFFLATQNLKKMYKSTIIFDSLPLL